MSSPRQHSSDLVENVSRNLSKLVTKVGVRINGGGGITKVGIVSNRGDVTKIGIVTDEDAVAEDGTINKDDAVAEVGAATEVGAVTKDVVVTKGAVDTEDGTVSKDVIDTKDGTVSKDVAVKKNVSVTEAFSVNKDGTVKKDVVVTEGYSPNKSDASDKNHNRRIYVSRHAERVNYVFSEWMQFFDESGNYVRKDLNMPKILPKRVNSPAAWSFDPPLTYIGMCQAKVIGDAMRATGAVISYAYCSPSYRCVQTCHALLEGLGMKHVRIRIEYALFEWMTLYGDNKLEWCTKDELYSAKFNIDMNYEPMMTEKELLSLNHETTSDFYRRNHAVIEKFLKTHESGSALIVGHACSPETCTRLLVGKQEREKEELMRLIEKVPFCGMVMAEYSPTRKEWELKETECFPVTHSKNDTFEWDEISN